jgi:hypothetical protein
VFSVNLDSNELKVKRVFVQRGNWLMDLTLNISTHLVVDSRAAYRAI